MIICACMGPLPGHRYCPCREKQGEREPFHLISEETMLLVKRAATQRHQMWSDADIRRICKDVANAND